MIYEDLIKWSESRHRHVCIQVHLAAHNFRVKVYSGRPFLDGTEPPPQLWCSEDIADAGTV